MITVDDIGNALTVGVEGCDDMAEIQFKDMDAEGIDAPLHMETVFALGLCRFMNSLLTEHPDIRLIDVCYMLERYAERRVMAS